MVGMANKNYVKKPASNSYFYLYVREHQGMLLGLSKLRKGGGGGTTCFHILGDICCMGRHR